MKRQSVIFFRILFLLYIIGVMYLCFGNFSDIHGIHRSYFGIPTDKIVHFIMFFPFPILGNWALGKRPHNWIAGVGTAVLLGVIGFAIAGGTELGQKYLTSWRMGDFADLKADCKAILLATIITVVINIARSCRK